MAYQGESNARPIRHRCRTIRFKYSLIGKFVLLSLLAKKYTDTSVHVCLQLAENSSRSDIGHPFTRETMAMKGSVMTSGNLELQHLSLSCALLLYFHILFFAEVQCVQSPFSKILFLYLCLVNRLTNKTLKKLVSCLYYQSYMLLDDYTRGLLHVSLEVDNFYCVRAQSRYSINSGKLPLRD